MRKPFYIRNSKQNIWVSCTSFKKDVLDKYWEISPKRYFLKYLENFFKRSHVLKETQIWEPILMKKMEIIRD